MPPDEKILTPDDTIIELDGEKLTAKQIRSERLMQADYTKKTTAAAEATRKANEVLQKLTPVLEWAELAKTDRNAARERMEDVLDEMESELRQAKKDGASKSEIKELKDEITNLKEANKQVAELDKQSNDLRKSDPVFKRHEDEILEYAAKWTEKHGIVDLEEAYASWKGRNVAKLKDDTEPVLTGGRSMSGTKGYEYNKSLSLYDNLKAARKARNES